MIAGTRRSHTESLRVFVASSTEGAPVATELRSILQAELHDDALVELWMGKFAFSDTAIESLETIAAETDFAVLVMTPDDVTVSRQQERLAPRDNLVFELGLFVGALGRERSILARDSRAEMKLPSDIFGVTALTYNAASANDLTSSLQAQCTRLAEQIRRSGARPKCLADTRASLAANAQFRRAVGGDWWERVRHTDGSALSFFSIAPDPLTGQVLLEGTSYALDGAPCAEWKSEMARLYPVDRRIAYLWRGKHPLPGVAQRKLHGYGTMEFKPPEGASYELTRGSGEFWDVDETQPHDTVFKPCEIRRVLHKTHRRLMTSGSVRERQELAVRVLEA